MKLTDQEIIDKANIVIANVPCKGDFFEIPILDVDEPSLLENCKYVTVRYRAKKQELMHEKDNPTIKVVWVLDKVVRY